MKLHARSTSRRWTVWHSKGPLGVAEAAFTHEMHRTDHSDYGIELEYDPVHCVEGTVGCELVAGLEVRPRDYRIFGKRRYDLRGSDGALARRGGRDALKR